MNKKIFQYTPSEIREQFLTLPTTCWYTYCQMCGR